MKRWINILAVVILAVTSCGKPSDISISEPKVEDFSMKSFNTFVFYASAGIDNPTAYNVTVDNILFDITYTGKVIGRITAEPVTLRARTNDRHVTYCKVKLSEDVTFLEMMRYVNHFDPKEMIIDGSARVRLKCGIKKELNVIHKSLDELLNEYEKGKKNDTPGPDGASQR